MVSILWLFWLWYAVSVSSQKADDSATRKPEYKDWTELWTYTESCTLPGRKEKLDGAWKDFQTLVRVSSYRRL